MKIQSYRDLKVWQTAMDVAALSYALTKNFPADERYGLTAQIRRAAASVAAECDGMLARCDEVGRMLRSLIRSIERHSVSRT